MWMSGDWQMYSGEEERDGGYFYQLGHVVNDDDDGDDGMSYTHVKGEVK